MTNKSSFLFSASDLIHSRRRATWRPWLSRELDGFEYEKLGGLEDPSNAAPYLRGADWFKQWLASDESYSPQPQDKVSIPGPKRMVDDFRAFCVGVAISLFGEVLNFYCCSRTTEKLRKGDEKRTVALRKWCCVNWPEPKKKFTPAACLGQRRYRSFRS